MSNLMHRHTLQVQNIILPRQAVVFTGQRPGPVRVETYLRRLHAKRRFLPYKADAKHIDVKVIDVIEYVESNLNVSVSVVCLREVQTPCGIRPPRECLSEHFLGVVRDITFRQKTVREVFLLGPLVTCFGPRHVFGEVVVEIPVGNSTSG
ncbi:hypothetical protein V8G54_015486 [Vigna mungo]|uniref:Uncharacterized protein n=1 Tax=Vigna mungo TaxID=3915 RepID=A0AAQ3NLA3_VIGMU